MAAGTGRPGTSRLRSCNGEVGAARYGEQGCAPHVVVRTELARLENDLQVRAAAAHLLHANDLVVHLGVTAREEGPAVDDHVDLVRAGIDDLARLEQLHVHRRLPRWKCR